MKYSILSRETAPQAATPTIDLFTQAWGMLPNIGGVIAAAPAALQLLWDGYQALGNGTFTLAEQHLVALAISHENGCGYCMAAHSTLAVPSGMSPQVLDAVRKNMAIADARLEQLRLTATRLVQARGFLSDEEQRAFFAAGFSQGQLIELVGWVSLKTLTNYVNHLAATPLDSAWEKQRWSEPAAA